MSLAKCIQRIQSNLEFWRPQESGHNGQQSSPVFIISHFLLLKRSYSKKKNEVKNLNVSL